MLDAVDVGLWALGLVIGWGLACWCMAYRGRNKP